MTSTDQMDKITPEERADLMGYCEIDKKWSRVEGKDKPECGHKWSHVIGHQFTTVRTFNSVKKR